MEDFFQLSVKNTNPKVVESTIASLQDGSQTASWYSPSCIVPSYINQQKTAEVMAHHAQH